MAVNRFKKGIENIKQIGDEQKNNNKDDTQHTYNTNDTYSTHNTNDTNNTQGVFDTTKASSSRIQNNLFIQNTLQVDELNPIAKRGKREERYGLLIDKQLKDDLKNLVNAEGGRSMNDFIVNILISYVETPENQEILKAYKALKKIKSK